MRVIAIALLFGCGDIAADIDEQEHLPGLYPHLHENPKLSPQKTNTAARPDRNLGLAGFDVAKIIATAVAAMSNAVMVLLPVNP